MPKKKYPNITKKDLEEGVKKWKEENEEYVPCSRCEAMITQLFANPFENKEAREAFMKDPSKLHCDVCKGKRKIKVPKYWEEEIEGEIDKRGFYKFWVETRLKRFIGYGKVLIKARKGEIVIKRIEE